MASPLLSFLCRSWTKLVSEAHIEKMSSAKIASPIPPSEALKRLQPSDGPLVWVDCEYVPKASLVCCCLD